MKMARFLVISLVLAGSSLPLAGAATSTGQPTLRELADNVKSSCQSDIQKFCGNITPGQGRVAECLDAQRDKLSTPCHTAWSSAEANISQRMDKAEVAFRKNCGQDVQKFCAEVPSGKGRLLRCLDQHKAELSGSCSGFQTALGQRLSEFLG